MPNTRTLYNRNTAEETKVPTLSSMTVNSKSRCADVYLEWETDITKTETKTLTLTRKSSIADAFLEWEANI